MFVCVFCERTFNLAPHSCPNCNDYKGLMTIADAVAEYDWLDYLVAQPIRYPATRPTAWGHPPVDNSVDNFVTILLQKPPKKGVFQQINVRGGVYTKGRQKKEMRNEMNKELNAKMAFDLAKENLEKLIALGLDTDEDYDQVYLAEQELKRASR